MRLKKEHAILLLLLLGIVNASSWIRVLDARSDVPVLYFLDVGQGDATLLSLGQINILVDAGPDRKLISELSRVRPDLRRLDMVVLTHPEKDHANGLRYLLREYSIGLVAINGRDNPEWPGWQEILQEVREKNIPLLALGRGDAVRYGESRMEIISPLPEFLESAATNDSGIVGVIHTSSWRAILAADIGWNVEEVLLATSDLGADILKVGHHGSKYSSSPEFLAKVRPEIALIGVGQDNKYGHPAAETMRRLETAGAAVFRTDEDGSIAISGGENGLLVRIYRK
jgi:competence protein ComEC